MSLILFLPFPSWHQLVSFIPSATVLMYVGAPLALGALRKQVPDARRPFRLSAAGFWSPLAFILAGLIIYWSGWPPHWRPGGPPLLRYLPIGIHAAFKLTQPIARLHPAHREAPSGLPGSPASP